MEFHWGSDLTNQSQVFVAFVSKLKNLHPNMKLPVFKNSKITIIVSPALSSESDFEKPLVLHGFRPVLTILGAFNSFQLLEIFIC